MLFRSNFKGIDWEWVYAAKKGQHHNHQKANESDFEWVWRIDDDCIPEPNVLEKLFLYTHKNVGAVGGSILTPPHKFDTSKSTGKIELIDSEPNIQWSYITQPKEVQHLHCSFLYRAGIHDYNLGLSRVAHREETLFTYGLYLKGYKILAVPNAVSWHLKNPNGGIRAETNKAMYDRDELIFRNILAYKDKKIVVLNCGMGDHIVFKKIYERIKDNARDLNVDYTNRLIRQEEMKKEYEKEYEKKRQVAEDEFKKQINILEEKRFETVKSKREETIKNINR